MKYLKVSIYLAPSCHIVQLFCNISEMSYETVDTNNS